MRILILFLFTMWAATASSQNIKGNVFYKYNDFIGNRPDAGAKVTAIRIIDTSTIYRITADVDGNFEFLNLPDGKYFVSVVSKNTNAGYYFNYIALKYNLLIEKVTGFNLDTWNPELQYKIKQQYDLWDAAVNSNSNKLIRTANEKWEVLNNLCYDFIKALPFDKYKILGMLLASDKLKLFEVDKKEGVSNKIVCDFGVSYSK